MKFLVPLLFSVNSLANECVPAREVVSVPHEGHYHRIHPSGNYFLYTKADSSYVVDITNRSKPITYITPMRQEAYPVEGAEGGWEFMAAPLDGGDHGTYGGMRNFKFGDMISENAMSSKFAFEDSKFGEFYHTSATRPGSKPEKQKIRTLLFSDNVYKDYDVAVSSDGSAKITADSGEKRLCGNMFPKPIERTSEATKKFKKEYKKVEKLSRMIKEMPDTPDNKKSREDLLKQMNDQIKKIFGEYYGPGYMKAVEEYDALDVERSETAKKILSDNEFKAIEEERQALKKEYGQADEEFKRDLRWTHLMGEYSEAKALNNRERSQISKERLSASIKKLKALQESFDQSEKIQKIQDAFSLNEKKQLRFFETNEVMRNLKVLDDKISEKYLEVMKLGQGYQLSQPVLSKDGTYVAGLLANKLTVFKINEDESCQLVFSRNYFAQKVSFSYPKKGEPLKLTFAAPMRGSDGESAGSGIYVVNLETGHEIIVSDENEKDPTYPGFTLDGRVMYKSEKKMVIADPLQIDEMSEGCIQAKSTKMQSDESGTSEK